MMIATTKLTFLVLIIPVSILIISDVAILWYYETIDVSASIATIAILFLVWERLRNSLLKKLDYLHDNCFFELYEAFRVDIFNIWKRTIESANRDLKRYGKFVGISLYSKGLSERIDKFLISYEKFSDRLFQIRGIGVKRCDILLSKDTLREKLWHHLLGIRHLSVTELQNYNGKPIFKLYADQANVVKKEKVELIEETKNLIEEIGKMKKEISEELEHFFKSNNLRLEAESSHISPPY